MTLRDIAVAVGFKVDKQSYDQANQSINSLASTAVKLLGAIGIGLSLKAMNAIAEEFNGINDQIRDATRGMGEQADIQQEILKAANDTKMSYGGAARNITQLIKMNENLFGSVESASNFASLFTKNLAAAGKSEGEISSAMSTFNRTLARGQLDAASYERMLRTYPEIINTIADGMNVSKEQLKKLAESGKVTSEAIISAYQNASGSIQARFDELDYSISDAMTNIRNQWGVFVDQLWTGSGITNGLGKTMVQVFTQFMGVLKKLQPFIERFVKWFLGKVQNFVTFFDKVITFSEKLIKKLGGIENLAKTLGIVFGVAFGMSKFNKIIDAIKKITKLLNPTMLVIIGIALLVEDFIQFMLGNDSLFGSLFDKIGVNAEDVRKTIMDVWNGVKNFLKKTWDGIKVVAGKIWGGLKSFWEKHSESIIGLFTSLWNAIKSIIGFIVNIVKEAIDVVTSWVEDNKEEIDAIFNEIVRIITVCFETITGLIQPAIDIFTGLLDFISDVFSGDWEAAWEDVKNIFSSVLEYFGVIIDGINELFGGLIDDALQWGKDVINNIVDGIKKGIQKVKDAVTSVGSTIAEYLHFSEPDKGPLSNFHTWMPDMMKGLSVGINDNQDLVMGGIKKLAGGISTLMQDATASVGLLGRKSSNVTQNVNFYNSYSGTPNEVMKSIRNTTNQSAMDATTLMARSLSIAR